MPRFKIRFDKNTGFNEFIVDYGAAARRALKFRSATPRRGTFCERQSREPSFKAPARGRQPIARGRASHRRAQAPGRRKKYHGAPTRYAEWAAEPHEGREPRAWCHRCFGAYAPVYYAVALSGSKIPLGLRLAYVWFANGGAVSRAEKPPVGGASQ